MMLDRESSSDAAAFEAAAGVTFFKSASSGPSRTPAAARADRDVMRLKQTSPGGDMPPDNAAIEFNPQFRDPVSLDPVFSVRGSTPTQGGTRNRVVDPRTARAAYGDRSSASAAESTSGSGLLGLHLGTSELTPVAQSIRQLIDGVTPGRRDSGSDPLSFDHDSTRDELNPFEPSQLVNSDARFRPNASNPNSVENRRARLNASSPLRELTARAEGNPSLAPTLNAPSVPLDAVRPLQSATPFELPGRKF